VSVSELPKHLGITKRQLARSRTRWRKLWTKEYEKERAAFLASPEGKDYVTAANAAACPDDATLLLMRKAVVLHVAGSPFREIGRALGVPEKTAYGWKRAYPQVWAAECKRCIAELVVLGGNDNPRPPAVSPGSDAIMDGLTAMIRQWAGTDAVNNSPDTYIALASKAMKWHDRNGTELFPAKGEPTLCTFYRDYYAPLRHTDAMPTTKRTIQAVLKKWALVTGDPAIKDITPAVIACYRDCLAKMHGKKPGRKMEAETIRTHLRTIQTILEKAGPSGRGNRDAANLIPGPVPWAKPPHADIPLPRIVSARDLAAVYRVADRAVYPETPGISAADWWRAMVVIAYNTGLRRRTLFEMKWSHVDLETGYTKLPPQTLKSKRWHLIHLHEECVAHLEKIKGPRELVFPWPHGESLFDAEFHRLQHEAGVIDLFGLSNLRKTLATVLASSDSPGVAGMALGHAGDNVTLKHYIHATGIVAHALDRVPQPWPKQGRDDAA
jgi:integrase